MTDTEFIEKAKRFVLEVSGSPVNTKEKDVQITWYCYLAGNRKAMLSTNAIDEYYEVTYIAKEDKMIIDAYKWIGKEER